MKKIIVILSSILFLAGCSSETGFNQSGENVGLKEEPILNEVDKYKNSLGEAFKFAMDGYALSDDAISYAVANDYEEGLKQAGEAKILYSKSLEKLNAINPPADYKKMHDFTIAGVNKFNEANDFIIIGLNKKDYDSLNKAKQLLSEGNLLIKQATQKLNGNN